MDNNVTLVIFPEVKNSILQRLTKTKEKLESGKNVKNAAISLEELDKLIKLSNKKIITYSELIKRDINSAKVYWD